MMRAGRNDDIRHGANNYLLFLMYDYNFLWLINCLFYCVLLHPVLKHGDSQILRGVSFSIYLRWTLVFRLIIHLGYNRNEKLWLPSDLNRSLTRAPCNKLKTFVRANLKNK